MENVQEVIERLNATIDSRSDLIDAGHVEAFRLFNGFYEGSPELVVDLYARTLVLFWYRDADNRERGLPEAVQSTLLERLPWVECVVHKDRLAPGLALRRGRVAFGGSPAEKVRENGVWYAIDLILNQDASLYLDTRNIRKWLLENAAGWRLLNMFAYTGSLGVAALASGAEFVVQVDRNRKFLSLARRSGMLNHLDIGKMKLRTGDFFSQVAAYKRSGELFDCVIVDPPFFSTTDKGTVDLVGESVRVINKVRPLVKNAGLLVTINNALFLSGAEYVAALESLCAGGYLSIEALIPVPQDVTGYPDTIVMPPPRDPAPFNHPTKIAILQVRRK